jgi:hypothetical protein
MNNRYTTPAKGTVDWHIPLNENFEQLDRDVEIRDVEANRSEYAPVPGAKFFAVDSGAMYTGNGESWNLVGYAARAVSGNIGHFVNYADGLTDEPVNTFLLDSVERLEITRLSFPIKGNNETPVGDAVLRVNEGDSVIAEVTGNSLKIANTDASGSWVATESPVTVTVSNLTGGSIAAIPKVWANIRR